MSFSFRPAVRESVGLLIGLAGSSGSGKTFSAMRLAAGIAGKKRFAVIDTEASRATHYADQFSFDHGDLKPPFRPSAYAEAIEAADKAGYPVIVVDSASHEHAGEGGLLDFHEAELDRMAGDDWRKREQVKMAAWIKPKSEHKRFASKLLQVRAHLILCFRAEEKIEMVRDEQTNKMKIIKKQTATGLDGWVPISEKSLPYELTASFLLLASNPGIPLPIKLQAQHRVMFPLDQPIDEKSGQRIAQWAAGSPQESTARGSSSTAGPASPEAQPAASGAPDSPDPLIVKAREMAESGESAYKGWWESISAADRKHVGAKRHEELKSVAAHFDRAGQP